MSMHDFCVHFPRKYSKFEFQTDRTLQGPVLYRIQAYQSGKLIEKLISESNDNRTTKKTSPKFKGPRNHFQSTLYNGKRE